MLFTLSSHSSGSLFVGFVLQSTAFCSAVGKVRNQSPREQPDVDTDKLCLSLSICLNGSDAQVGSLEEAASARRCAMPHGFCVHASAAAAAAEGKVCAVQVYRMKFTQFTSRASVWNESK